MAGRRAGKRRARPIRSPTFPVESTMTRAAPTTGPQFQPSPLSAKHSPISSSDIVRGGYYGHPNSSRGEYVLNGGNPDGKNDSFQVHDYPVGTPPDRNWHKPVWNLGMSPAATD